MEPADDPRLKGLLREWQVPDAPRSLDERVLLGRRRPWWRRLATSRITVPLPIAAALCVVLVWLAALAVRDRGRALPAPATTEDLGGFQPVSSVSVRIERSRDVP
jgi:hypothetical protein